MTKIGQKGIAHILLLIMLIAGIGLTVYLVQQKTNLFPFAASNPISGPITSPSPSPSPTPTPTPSPSPTSTPLPATFKGEYFNNKNLLGTPVIIRDDAAINFNWGSSAPAAVIPRDLFSIRWIRPENFIGGNYRFTLKSNDGLRVYIDGNLVYNEWSNQHSITKTFDTAISAGVHTIKVEYYENKGQAEVFASWIKL